MYGPLLMSVFDAGLVGLPIGFPGIIDGMRMVGYERVKRDGRVIHKAYFMCTEAAFGQKLQKQDANTAILGPTIYIDVL